MNKNNNALQKKEYEFLNQIPNGIAVIEVNPKHAEESLHMIYYNDYFFCYSGYTREECDILLQKNVLGLVFEEDISLLLTDIIRICEQEVGSFSRSMVRCRTKEDGCHWILFNGLLVQKSDSVCRFNITMVDISDLGGKSNNSETVSDIDVQQDNIGGQIIKKNKENPLSNINPDEQSVVQSPKTGEKTPGAEAKGAEAEKERAETKDTELKGTESPDVKTTADKVTDDTETDRMRYHSKRRILIVDDNSTTRLLLIKTLSEDYIIETAKDGVEAMSRLWYFGSTISALLLDLIMPGVDGFEILKKMQTNIDLRKIPVIIVSSDDDRETIRKAMEYGAVDFITKPVDTELLQLRLKSTINRTEKELQWVE